MATDPALARQVRQKLLEPIQKSTSPVHGHGSRRRRSRTSAAEEEKGEEKEEESQNVMGDGRSGSAGGSFLRRRKGRLGRLMGQGWSDCGRAVVRSRGCAMGCAEAGRTELQQLNVLND